MIPKTLDMVNVLYTIGYMANRPSSPSAQMSAIGKRDFSVAVNRQLAARGFVIVGIQAVPAYEGDVYFSGTAYRLIDTSADGSFVRTYAQVKSLAETGEGAPKW